MEKRSALVAAPLLTPRNAFAIAHSVKKAIAFLGRSTSDTSRGKGLKLANSTSTLLGDKISALWVHSALLPYPQYLTKSGVTLQKLNQKLNETLGTLEIPRQIDRRRSTSLESSRHPT